MPTIHSVTDRKRGCGWRKPGGLYMMGSGLSVACAKLPCTLEVCPCCKAGIKPCRSWTWIDGDRILDTDVPCEPYCPLGTPGLGQVGLLWIGEEFYATPIDFMREAVEQGVSRRIPAVPKGFEIGRTRVMLAHRRLPDGSPCQHIFRSFVPDRIEYVVKGDETEDELNALSHRGITLVKVTRDETNDGMDEFPF